MQMCKIHKKTKVLVQIFVKRRIIYELRTERIPIREFPYLDNKYTVSFFMVPYYNKIRNVATENFFRNLNTAKKLRGECESL